MGRESEREGAGEVAGKFPMIDTTLLLALPAVDMVLRGGTHHSTSFSLHAVKQNPVCSMSVHCVYFKQTFDISDHPLKDASEDVMIKIKCGCVLQIFLSLNRVFYPDTRHASRTRKAGL